MKTTGRTHIFLISIVTYNNAGTLAGLLSDITQLKKDCERGGLTLKVRFFDNCSSDETVPMIRRHGFAEDLTISERNLGFGAGHNRNFQATDSDVIVVCNPDICFEPDAFKVMKRRFEESPTMGMLLPNLVYPDGSEQHLCKRNPTFFDIFLRRFAPQFVKSLFGKRMEEFIMEDHDYNEDFLVEYGSGSFMAIRSEAYRAAGGFDERYFMYIEDADITREISNAGYECIYTPAVKVVHHYNKGSYHSFKLAWINIISCFKYSWKWNVEKRMTHWRQKA